MTQGDIFFYAALYITSRYYFAILLDLKQLPAPLRVRVCEENHCEPLVSVSREWMAAISALSWLGIRCRAGGQLNIQVYMLFEVPALPPGSHGWVKWRRLSSGCTFSLFSRPSIMHLWIKIEGTLEDLSERDTHTHTHTHTSTTCPCVTHSNLKCLSLHRPNMDTIIYAVHSLRSGISPGPLLLRAPWQRRGCSRVSTPETGRVAGQSSAA